MHSSGSRKHKRDATHGEVAETLATFGWSVFDASKMGAGCPDLLVGLNGITDLVEVKSTAKSGYTDDQVEFNRTWRGSKPVRLENRAQAEEWCRRTRHERSRAADIKALAAASRCVHRESTPSACSSSSTSPMQGVRGEGRRDRGAQAGPGRIWRSSAGRGPHASPRDRHRVALDGAGGRAHAGTFSVSWVGLAPSVGRRWGHRFVWGGVLDICPVPRVVSIPMRPTVRQTGDVARVCPSGPHHLVRAEPAQHLRSGEFTAQEIVYAGAGSPVVRDPAGVPLREESLGRCARCGRDATLRIGDCLSSNFVVCKQLRLGAKGFCRACAFCLRDLRLRCAPWIATPTSVRFCVDRWGILDFLLAPPQPPFVAGVPWFGVSKGGLGNLRYCRVWHPDREKQELSPAKVDDDGTVLREPQVMPKLQSKHTAIFGQTAVSRERYPLAIDDGQPCTVDVELWKILAANLTTALRFLPVPCLEEWRAPRIDSDKWREGVMRWTELTAPLAPYRQASWWPLLLAIVPRPERTVLHAIQ
jgi:hypothetical protein